MALLGCATGHSTAAPLTAQARTFVPYDAAGQLTSATDGAARHGSCWTGSIAVPVAGAYRCLAQNRILDPCFAAPGAAHPRTVACFVDPWHPATVLAFAAAPPASAATHAGSPSRPWALELANGARCVVVTGMVPAVHGVSLGYSCGSGQLAGLTGGTGEPATAAYGPPQGPLRHVAVAVEWRVSHPAG